MYMWCETAWVDARSNDGQHYNRVDHAKNRSTPDLKYTQFYTKYGMANFKQILFKFQRNFTQTSLYKKNLQNRD